MRSSESIGPLVTGKARSFLRTASALVLLALVVAGTYLVLMERQVAGDRADFEQNPAVHLIRVAAPDTRGVGGYLKFSDVAAVKAAAGQAAPATPVRAAVQYELNFGIEDAEGESYFVYGLGGAAAEVLGVDRVEQETAYPATARAGDTIDLQVPIVDVSDDGMSSSRRESVPMAAGPTLSSRAPVALLDHAPSEGLYLGGRTFAAVASQALGKPWRTIRREYDEKNDLGVQLIGAIYVHVEDLDDVQPVAEQLEAAGYPTTYTLKAFDDLAGNLATSALLALLVVAAALLAGLVYIVLSFNSFLRISHKDLAILKHSGFSDREVTGMYRARARSILGSVGAVLVALLAALGVALLGGEALTMTAMNVGIFGGLLLATYAIVAYVVIPRHVRLDVLTLLKAGREFG